MERQTQRIIALDAFRGLTVAAMILVNNPGSWGSIFPPLEHAEWNGCTPTDLVFPFFLFIVGVSMWFSFKRYDHRLTSQSAYKIAKRAFLIFLIGILLTAFPFYNAHPEKMRILGVLQRIGLAFGFAAFICIGVKDTYHKFIGAFLLLGYWFALVHWGGDDPYSLTTNLVRKIDLSILGPAHLWKGKDIPFDPEGLLSTIPAIVSVMLGYHSGRLLDKNKGEGGVNLLLVRGLVLIFIGMMWNLVMPINKSLWTSSFVLYTAGLGMCVLGVSIWLIDIKGNKKIVQPFIEFGSNALFVFVASGLLVKSLSRIMILDGGDKVGLSEYIYSHIYMPLDGAEISSVLYAITWVFLMWIVAHILYKKNIFVKI